MDKVRYIRKNLLALAAVVALTASLVTEAGAAEDYTTNTVIALGSHWNYLDNGSDQGTVWSTLGFDDSSWSRGPAELGYGDGDEATTVNFGPTAANKYITTYFRHSFTIEDPTLVEEFTARLIYDDGGVIYINGAEVHRTSTMAQPPTAILFDTAAVSTSGDNSQVVFNPSRSPLVAGTNVMAVEIHQNSGTSSDISFDLELIGIFLDPTNFRPSVTITAPANDIIAAAPASLLISADASDRDGTVDLVSFYANGIPIGSDANGPYSLNWNNVAEGFYVLTVVATDNWGLSTTSDAVNITVSADAAPPVIGNKSPEPGTITELTQLTVVFSKNVTGVEAADLLVNGVPAEELQGSGDTFTFVFPQPSYGSLTITWASGHGITDLFTPPHPFNANGAGATWAYQLIDVEPPIISVLDPVPNSSVSSLTSIYVTFNEPVTGVNAADMAINSVAANSLTGSGVGPYIFGFPQPPVGNVPMAWASGHGIQDAAGNAFLGDSWTYLLDTNSAEVVISEIMYHPNSENVAEEYIELNNRGTVAVNLGGWQLSRGINFIFPSNLTLQAGSYLVVAADTNAFRTKYPGVNQVIGNWNGILSNSGEDVELENERGNRVDIVPYADEGEWAVRRRGSLDGSNRDWSWYREHDGLGASLELINSAMPNQHGQNWASSLILQGTPGAANSVSSTNMAPLILNVQHFPIVPASSDPVAITARIEDELPSGLMVFLFYREALNPPPAFSAAPMRDDGLNGDGVANDGLYGAMISARPNNTVIEYYVQASDAQNNIRAWPAPALPRAPQTTPLLLEANAMYQVDDNLANTFGGVPSKQPVYKIIMTEFERANLASGNRNSDAQRNCTFISLDGTGVECRQLIGIRFRGHGSRGANPPNYRINLRSDMPWQNMVALNLNTRQVHLQHVGATIANAAGAVGPYSRAVQVRVNNANLASSGAPMYGSYAANEPMNSEWAERHFPFDNAGNIYKVVHDISPGLFNYRGEDPNAYRNTYFKGSNVSEDDWTGLIGMLRAVGIDNATPFTTENVRQVINVEQWLTHMAVMNLFGNNESGLNTANNDDFLYYQGVVDPRFNLVFWDQDTILGQGGSLSANVSIWTAAIPDYGDSRGISYPVFDRLMHWPDFEPIYYRILQNLLDTTFSAQQFDSLVEQTLASYVPRSTIDSIKSWMTQRRDSVQSQINGLVTPAPSPLIALISGEPRSPTPFTSATLTVGGAGLTHYRYKLNNGNYGPETLISTPLQLTALTSGNNYTVSVMGRNATAWQSENEATVSQTWTVNSLWPSVRINEVLADNSSAVDHFGTTPDLIELYNEGPSAVALAGMGITDAPNSPYKYVFPANTTLGIGQYLVLYANNADGTPGMHLGFNLSQDGEGIYLYHRPQDGGALLDSVVYGFQVSDLSIGRLGGAGAFWLTQPTFGLANTPADMGLPSSLRINEWLASGLSPFSEDFVELYNPGNLPISLDGLFFSDVPFATPTRHRIAPLCFIGGQRFVNFVADGQTNSGPDHLNFRLSSQIGEIALFNHSQGVIDRVIYGPQQVNAAIGRCPDGSMNLVEMPFATPGIGNACSTAPQDEQYVTLIPSGHTWKYNTTSGNLGTAWKEPVYDDSNWASGAGLFYDPTSRAHPYQSIVRTTLPQPSVVTYYFRAEFTVPANLAFTSLQFSNVVDDGAVYYLNGLEVGRTRMTTGSFDANTVADGITDALWEGPLNIPLANLQSGINVFAVELHQNSPTSADALFGLQLDGVIITNTSEVVLNEIMADNATMKETDGSTPDWVEIYNPSSNAVDLAGMSLTDQVGNPRQWVFPSPTILPGQSYYVVYFDADKPPSATNTGFGLSGTGDSVYLFASEAEGGGARDWVAFGIQPADWSIGRAPDGSGSWQLTVATPRNSNFGPTMGSELQLKVNEWMAAPASGDDWFEIYNPNPQPVALGGLWLTDTLDDRQNHLITPLSFIGTGSNAFVKFVADGNLAAGADHVSFSLKASGEAVGISRSSGLLIDGFAFGPQQSGVSQGRLPDGNDVVVFFPETASPGDPNYVQLTTIVINEVLTHTDPPLQDAIELFNPTPNPVDISGWWLSDAKNTPTKYQIEGDTVLEPGAFMVLLEFDSFNNSDIAAIPFALSSSKGDEVYLSSIGLNGLLSGYRTSVEFDAAENGVSFGRFQTSVGIDFPASSQLTLNSTNAYPKVGPIVISEIMYHPPDILVQGVPEDNLVEEFIELHNITSEMMPLYDPLYSTNGWRLRNAVDFDFDTRHRIPAGGYLLVVSFDPATNLTALAQFQSTYGTNSVLAGPYQGKLNNSDETIKLRKPDTPQLTGNDLGFVPYILVESVSYLDHFPWSTNADGQGMSLQRINPLLYGNEPANWFAAAPSPGPGSALDSDLDGMPDSWELTYQLDPNNPSDADDDSDGDGVNNRQEYISGTNPREKTSYLKVVSVAVIDGQVHIQFQAVAGKSYSVLYTTDLGSGVWDVLQEVPVGVVGEVTVIDPSFATEPYRNYRLITPHRP